MKPTSFDYRKPRNLDEALALINAEPPGRILAGGQSLVPMMNFRLATPEVIVDINGLGELDYMIERDEILCIGALARHARVRKSQLAQKYCPLMVEAYHFVAHGPIQNRGTLAGNLANADPSSEMPAVMQCVDATFVIQSATAKREVQATKFFVGPFTTALEVNELLVEIQVPKVTSGWGYSFQELSFRKGDFAIAAVACCLRLADDTCGDVRVALTGVSDRAVRARATEKRLIGTKLSHIDLAAAAEIAAHGVDTIETIHASAEYRRDMIRVLTARALAIANQRARATLL